MKNANPEAVKEQLLNLFEIDPSDVILASAKNGIGISEIFEVSQLLHGYGTHYSGSSQKLKVVNRVILLFIFHTFSRFLLVAEVSEIVMSYLPRRVSQGLGENK